MEDLVAAVALDPRSPLDIAYTELKAALVSNAIEVPSAVLLLESLLEDLDWKSSDTTNQEVFDYLAEVTILLEEHPDWIDLENNKGKEISNLKSRVQRELESLKRTLARTFARDSGGTSAFAEQSIKLSEEVEPPTAESAFRSQSSGKSNDLAIRDGDGNTPIRGATETLPLRCRFSTLPLTADEMSAMVSGIEIISKTWVLLESQESLSGMTNGPGSKLKKMRDTWNRSVPVKRLEALKSGTAVLSRQELRNLRVRVEHIIDAQPDWSSQPYRGVSTLATSEAVSKGFKTGYDVIWAVEENVAKATVTLRVGTSVPDSTRQLQASYSGLSGTQRTFVETFSPSWEGSEMPLESRQTFSQNLGSRHGMQDVHLESLFETLSKLSQGTAAGSNPASTEVMILRFSPSWLSPYNFPPLATLDQEMVFCLLSSESRLSFQGIDVL